MGEIHNKQELNTFRKELRNGSTSAEATLWLRLKGKQLEGRKFRRQHSIGSYVVDFFCASEGLVVELDGAHHYTEEGFAHDQRREEFLRGLKMKVLRFENRKVFDDIDMVLEVIKSHFERELPKR